MKTKPAPSAASATRRATPLRRQPLRRTCLALLIAACFEPALANPSMPQVVSGQASFAQQGNVFSITNTPNAIINWQSFSVNAGELTRFIQQSAGSTVLNRITGQDPSQILGALQSNGKVFLINPNGVLFGRDARVDVNGLVASSLAISNADFLAGNYRFDAGAVAGAVSNQGSIATPAGGQVILLAPNVENSGIITAPNGQVMLAAGHSVQLADAANPSLQVTLAAPADQAINLGQVIAQGGRIGMYGALVNQRGRLSADSAVLGENGKIVLKASGTTLLEAGSRTSATGAGKGGEIEVLGRRVGLTGDAGVDASGVLGGGSILVGGDYRGANAAVMNAEQSYLGAGATLTADATGRGDGGKVIVWSDNATRVFGHISARGGARGGDGGFVETSGHYLDMQASVDTTAPLGRTGQLLLDPSNIYIADDASTAIGAGMSPPGPGPTGSDVAENGGGVFSETSSSTDSLLTITALQGALAGANVTVTTSNPSAPGAGFIKLVNPLGWISGRSLTLDAAAGISLDAGINGGDGALTLLSASGDITQSAPMNVAGLTARAPGGNVFLTNAGNAIGGAVTLQAAQQVSLTAAALNIAESGSGTDTTINTTGGALTISGNVGSVEGVVSLNAGVGGNLNITGTGVVQGGGNNLVLTGDNIVLDGTVNAAGGNVLLAAGDVGRPGAIDVGASGVIDSVGGNVVLKADNIDLLGAINAGAGAVALEPTELSQSIHVGVGATDTVGTLGLSEAELRRISTSGLLKVGASGSEGGSDLTVVGNLDLSTTLNAGTVNGDLLLAVNQGNLTVNAGAQVVVPAKLNLRTSTYDEYTIINNGSLKAAEVHLASGKMELENGLVDAPVVSMSSRNAIDLGSATESQLATLELSNAELATLNAGSDLRIEVLADGGDNITISAPLTVSGSLTLAALGTVSAPAALSVGGKFLLDDGDWVQNSASLPAFSANDFQINRGAASFLRVRGGDGGSNPYQIADVYGLQGIATLPMGSNYLLAADIDATGTANWNGLEGFVPIGDGDGTNFSGVFDGAGRTISGLTINLPGSTNVGMFAALAGGAVVNFTLLGGSVRGGEVVGALIGDNLSGSVDRVFSSASVNGVSTVGGLVGRNAGDILASRSSGTVVGTGENVGGLVGELLSGAGLDASAASGSVTGERNVGGLVGRSGSLIQDAFALGAVNGTANDSGFTHENLGGLVGENATGSVVNNTYSRGAVGGADFANVGGVAGFNDGSMSAVYWNGEASGIASGIGASGTNGSANPVVLTNAQSMQQASFAGFGFTGFNARWRIYEGHTDPLLRPLLSPLTADISAAASRVYDGTQSHFSGTIGYTGLSGGDTAANGTLDYTTAARNVGTYTLDGLWSNKYDISYTGATSLGITARALTVSVGGSKVYDGSLGFSGAVYTLNNLVAGDSVTVGGSASFADKNAGTGKTVSAEVGLSGADVGNYSYSSSASGLADITPATVSIINVNGLNKIYDGGTAATIDDASVGLSGVLTTDSGNVSLALGASNFLDKNVGTGKTINMVGASLTGTEAGNYVLASANASTSADITARTLNVSYAGVNKVYDGGTGATFTSTDDRVGGDILTVSASASFGDKNVGPSKTIASSGASLAGTDALNYMLAATSGSATAAITARLLSVTYTGVDKIYDGGVSASINLIGDDRVTGDFVDVTGFSGVFGDKNVGTGKAISVSGATLSGNDAGNYVLSSAIGAATADITPASLSIASLTGVNRIYNGGVAASVSGTVGGVIGSDDVSLLAGASTFGDKNVGTGKTITMSGASLSGVDAGNYALASTGGTTTADITPATLSIAGLVGANRVYDGGTAASVSGGVSGLFGSDDVALVSGTSTFGDKNVGTGKTVTMSGATLSGTDAGNYVLASTGGTATADITQATLSIASLTGESRVYDGTTAANVSGTVSGVFGSDDVALVVGSSSFGDKNAGTGKVVTMSGAGLTGADAGNYALASTGGSTTADITQRTLNVTYSGVNKVYDGSTVAALTFSDDRVAGDVLGVGASASFDDKNVGTGKTVNFGGASLTGADAGNYLLAANSGGITADITPRALTVTYNGIDKVYDGTLGASLGSTDDRVAGDLFSVSASGNFLDRNVGSGKAVGVSGASLFGADAGNYTVADGGATTASITPRALTVNYNGVDKVYDGGVGASFNVVGDDRIFGDSVGVSASASFADKNAGPGKTVSISGATLSGVHAGNYTLAGGGSTTANITPRTLNVVYTGVDKVYDGGTGAAFTSSDDRVSGDDISPFGTASFADKNAGAGKPVTISGVSLAGGDAPNYVVAGGGSATAAITPRLLSVFYSGVSRVYDGGVFASVNAAGDDRLSGDVLSVAASGSFADKNVGGGKTVSISGASLSGADAGNYMLAGGASTTAAITPRTLTVSYNGVNRVYDGGVVAGVVAGADDRVSGDVLGVSASGSFADKNVGTGKAITVGGASLSGTDAGNYVLAANSAGTSADITARNLNLSYSAGNKVYDGGVAASVSSTDDRVAGDQLSVSQSASFSDKNAGANKKVTLSSVLLSGPDGGNYVAIYSPALLASISQANLFLSGATVASRVYDGTLLASVTGGSLSGVLGQDQVFVSGGQGSFADKNVGTGKLVKATGFVLGGADAANYALGSASVDGTADITARTLNLSYSALGKVYDGGTLASVVSSDDRVAGDVFSVSQSASFSDKNVGSGKLVKVSGVALGGADAGNYVVGGGAQATADITPATLTLSGVSAASRAYDGSTVASVSASLGGVIGSDAVVLDGGVGNFSDKNVGSGKSVAVSGFGLSGADAGNYLLSFNGASATADITQKLLSTWVGAAGGLWSDALNWDGGVVPDGANVLAVNLSGSGVVDYSAAAGSTTIGTLSGSQGLSVSGGILTLGNAAGDASLLTGSPGLSVSGGSLQLRGGLTVDDFAQSGGVVGGSGNLSVRRSFSQSAGSLGIEGVLAVVQAAGDLSFVNLSAASVTLAAEAGRISQSGALVTTSLDARAQNGITLTDSGNRVGAFSASNSGSGGIALTNTSNPGTLLLGTLSSGSGDIVVDNTGGIETHAISTSGNVSVTAHSPIQVEGAISGSDIDLSASTEIVLGSASSLAAQQDVSMTAGTGIELKGSARVSAGGNISLATASGDIVAGSGVTINGAGTVSLSAPLGTLSTPSSIFTGSAPNVVSQVTDPTSPVTLAQNATVNIINAMLVNLVPPLLPPLLLNAVAAADGGTTAEKKVYLLDKADDKGTSSASSILGMKNEPIKKMYCN